MGDLFKQPFTDIACNVTAVPGKTILQITNPSTQRLRIKELVLGFDGISSVAVPTLIRLARQTTAGTPSGSSTPTPVLVDPGGPAALQTAVLAGAAAWTAEPTLGDILFNERIHPQGGLTYQYVLGQEDIIAPSGRLALIVVAAASVNLSGHLVWET
jgi:hypothetical protein